MHNSKPDLGLMFLCIQEQLGIFIDAGDDCFGLKWYLQEGAYSSLNQAAFFFHHPFWLYKETFIIFLKYAWHICLAFQLLHALSVICFRCSV